MSVDSPVEIEIYGSYDDASRTGDLTIVVTATESFTNSNLKLRIALTESHINWHAPNGINVHNQTFRDMIPNYSGISFAIDECETLIFNQSFSCPSPLIPENCEIVVFVQSDSDRRILQGAKENITSIPPSSFLTPFCLISPENNTTVETCYPTFTWNASDDPNSGYDINYQVYVSPDPTFENPTIISEPISETTWDCPICLQNGAQYYWKVLALNGSAPDRFCIEVFGFNIREQSIPVPTLSEWGMIVLALLILAVGTVAVIRRRKIAAAIQKTI